MKSTIAARFFCRKLARAAHSRVCVGPTLSPCVNSMRETFMSSGS